MVVFERILSTTSHAYGQHDKKHHIKPSLHNTGKHFISEFIVH